VTDKEDQKGAEQNGAPASLTTSISASIDIPTLHQSVQASSDTSKEGKGSDNSASQKPDTANLFSTKAVDPASSKTSSSNTSSFNTSSSNTSTDSTAMDHTNMAAEKTSKQLKKPSRRAGFALFFAFIALLSGLAALAASAWLFLQGQQLQQAIAEQSKQQGAMRQLQQTTERHLAGADEQAKALSQSLNSQQKKIQTATESSLVLAEQLSELDQKVTAITTTDRSDWLLAEAEFLLRLANERVFLGGNSKDASQLLKSADQILMSVDEMALMPIRQALAQDMLTLASVIEHDRVGHYLKLDAMIDILPRLQVITAEAPKGEELSILEQVGSEQSVARQLQQGWAAAWRKLKSYVRIQKKGQTVEPLPSIGEQALVLHNLRILLNQAQLALMSDDQILYDHSLNKAKVNVAMYLNSVDSETQTFIAKLNEYSDYRLAGHLPDISRSRQLLKAHLDKRHYQPSLNRRSAAASKTEVRSLPESESELKTKSESQAQSEQSAETSQGKQEDGL
jgi:uroporphyrin-3 C-methyltransferase